ncbi:MAG TPA: MarP family serine protease [Acidimicrobiales bacterium]|nr:MarP family serine protease [Acidimicrobiales bacterium]
MNLFDLVIVVAALAAAVGGYRLGFLARATSWIGLGVGLFLGARFLPAAMRLFEGPDPTSKLLVAAVVLIGGAFAGQALGLVIGSAMGRSLPHGPARSFDRTIGALVGTAGVLISVWLLLPAIADVPGTVSRQARGSVLARLIDRNAPRAPDTLQALRRLVGDTNFPRVFNALEPAPATGPPPASTGLSQTVLDRVSASTVKVTGEACNRVQEGSGFAAGPDTIVTNAHVVAGERTTTVMRPDGRKLRATVQYFDPDRDLAVLRVAGLGQPPLGITTARVGQRGAVFGHPGGRDPLRIAPAAIRQRVDAVGRDLYDSHNTRRDVFILASDLRPGDSGGALVNANGAVVGVAFAIAPDRPGTAYALTSRELSAALAAPRQATANTGRCLRRG